jgi:hypothetical protein
LIRNFQNEDEVSILELLHANELPEECLPDLTIRNAEGKIVPNPLFVVKRVFDHDGHAAMLCFLKIRSELYFFVDHTVGTPEERWEMLKEFTEDMKVEAAKQGLDQMTAFVPPEMAQSFGKRLEDLGFKNSGYVPYSLNIE